VGQTRSDAIEYRREALTKALDSLGRYKFFMFGYWAAQWVSLNRLICDEKPGPNPFKTLVLEARRLKDGSE